MSYTNVVFKQQIGLNVNRDAIQHQRIDDRIGFQSRFQTAGTLIFRPPQQSSLNATQHQRFNKNHDVNDRIKRQNDKQKQQNFYNARLQKRMVRQQQKWQNQIQKSNKQQQKRLHHQKIILENKRNSNGLGYNPISHAYQQTTRGQALKKHDQGKEVNRYVRSKNIIQKNNTNFNIITGQQKAIVNQKVPQKFRQKVEQKYVQMKERQAVKYVPKRDKYDYLDDQN